ncbi:MAG: hypothetical protein JWN38_256 [Candidatus Saccharibacteria bacterium]|nr:hypothetical protein [Candidatus Saccharibacteria bacterium]
MKQIKAIAATVAGVLVMVSGTAVVSAITTTTTISSVVSPVITLFSSNGTVNINALPTGGGVQTIASDTVTVSTNDASGYTLQLNETSGSSALVSGGNSIPATAGTFGTPIPEAVNTWGYRVDSLGTFGAGPTNSASNAAISGSIKFAAVPATASPQTLKTTATTASSDTTAVWYGVAVNTTQASGTYTNGVTYTATAN